MALQRTQTWRLRVLPRFHLIAEHPMDLGQPTAHPERLIAPLPLQQFFRPGEELQRPGPRLIAHAELAQRSERQAQVVQIPLPLRDCPRRLRLAPGFGQRPGLQMQAVPAARRSARGVPNAPALR